MAASAAHDLGFPFGVCLAVTLLFTHTIPSRLIIGRTAFLDKPKPGDRGRRATPTADRRRSRVVMEIFPGRDELRQAVKLRK